MQKSIISILILGALVACSTHQSPESPTVGIMTSTSQFLATTSTPYPTATISQSPPIATLILPTPTPELYLVELNDTLTGIARKFNISLEELLAANPTIGSQALTVGLAIVIPPPQNSILTPTPTPWPVSIQQTQCYSNQDGSLWCLALLKNEFIESLQNLSVGISLLDSAGKDIIDQTAYAPLDVLPAGRSIIISALFPAPIPEDYRSQTRLLSASRLPASDSRYPLIHLQNNLVQVDWGGLSARISGQVMLDPRSDEAGRVWILAVAYERSGNVIGFRRWEFNDSLSPAEVLTFDFSIASLGPEIDHVDILVEAAK
jgi:LysM repeat protein